MSIVVDTRSSWDRTYEVKQPNYVAQKSQSNDTHPSYETDSHVASFCKNDQLEDGLEYFFP